MRSGEGTLTGDAEFELADWRVQPSLNRLVRDGVVVRLEPKLMDVLLELARRAPQVVPKSDLADAVWPDVFVSDSVLTRAIAGLRRAFGDDAQRPRFIETIAKRGYRLLVAPQAGTSVSPSQGATVAAPPALPERLTALRAQPGQWVRGERFHGRAELLAEVLDGPRNGIWLLGSRAVGKTSTLKQLEHLTANGGRGYFPLFWDLQGSDDPAGLDDDFREALREAEARLARVELGVDEIAAGGFLAGLGRLRRALAPRGLRLLLLIDEAEELLDLEVKAPALLRKLRRALQSGEGVRTVLASSARLWRLAEASHGTSPFLHGFAPPAYVGALDEAAARRLVRQALALDEGAAETAVATVTAAGGCHPYLLQSLCAELRRVAGGFGGSLPAALDAPGVVEAAFAAVGADATVRSLFAVDYGLLNAHERAILGALAGGDAPPDGSDAAGGLLHLERVGAIRELGAQRFEIASPIFARWLAERSAAEEA